MTVTAGEHATGATGSGPRCRFRRRAVLSALAVVVLATVVTTVWVRHYAAAEPLEVGNSAGWLYPDSLTVRQLPTKAVDGRFVTTSQVDVRPRHDQSFLFWVHNPSSVTQTILGLAGTETSSALSTRIRVSTTDPTRPGTSVDPAMRSPAVSVPPHESREVHYVFRVPGCWPAGRGKTWTSIALRVRTGAFTRTDTVLLANSAFELVARHRTC